MALVLVCLVGAARVTPLEAGTRSLAAMSTGAFDPGLQRALAERFAPRLVFHPDERFFPCAPAGGELAADPGGASPGLSLAARTRGYQGRPLAEKALEAVVYYHVYPHWTPAGQPGAVVEYWFYYLRNEYSGRGGLIPTWADLAHPNDMEHAFLVLEAASPAPEGPAGYRLRTVLCSAHEINNTRNFHRGDGPEGHFALLVERGSHAMCPDLDGDGRFTPGKDGDPRQKYCWGLRDRGISWAWWDPSFADDRSGPDAPRFRWSGDPGADDARWKDAFAYELESVDGFPDSPRKATGGPGGPEGSPLGPGSRFKAFFGLADGEQPKLWVPGAHENFGRPERVSRNRMAGERGFLVGYSHYIGDCTLVLNARYGICTGRGLLPDLILDGNTFLTSSGRAFQAGEVAAYYPVDRLANVFVGGGVLCRLHDLADRQAYAVCGIEYRLGRFRFRAAFYSKGATVPDRWEFRCTRKF